MLANESFKLASDRAFAEAPAETPGKTRMAASTLSPGTESFLGGSKESTDIAFSNLTLTLKPKKKGTNVKVILDNLSGTVYSGKLTALMGPSGSGKTSYV